MEHQIRSGCDYLRNMALNIESISHNLEYSIYSNEHRFAMSARLQDMKPVFLQHYYEHESHDCLGRLSMVAYDIEKEARANPIDQKLAEVIELSRAA